MGIFDKIGSFFTGSVSIDSVISVLDNTELTVNQIKTEKNVERIIINEFKEKFDKVYSQYNIGGYLGLKIDIDIGNGAVGVELKLASQLKDKSVNIQRLFGQAVYYKKRAYNNENLLILIVGDDKLHNDPSIEEVIDFLEDELEVKVYYLTAVKSRK